jgi:uncharacterized coiled-coil protein SlyX
MVSLTPDNYRSILRYYAALKQFLSMSSGPTKVNPNRAAKAREKLLKLSMSQFFELSTDVYDELQRRIDESQDEPDFLLPMANFHPKRNEAREKLGSLQPGRFRDLVSDIYFEIERRQLHNAREQEEKRVSVDTVVTSDTASVGSPQEERRSVQSIPPTHPVDSRTQGSVKTLQSTTVIPTKADMAWSSDEDDEDSLRILNSSHIKTRSLEISKGDIPSVVSTTEKRLVNGTQSWKPVHTGLNQATGDVGASSTAMAVGAATLAAASAITPAINEVSPENGSPISYSSNRNSYTTSPKRSVNRSSKAGSLDLNGSSHNEPRIQRGLSISQNRNKDRDIELLLAEGTKMDQRITNLEQKSALLQSKADKFESENETLHQMRDDMSNRIQMLEAEISKKDATIKDLESQLKSAADAISSSNRGFGHGSDANWNPRYDQLKLQKIEDFLALDAISEESLQKYVAKNGLVPLRLITQLHDSIKSFLLKLDDKSVSDNTSVLFEQVHHIAEYASKIASYAPHSTKADLVRSTVSHAITSTRYFTLYAELLPKLIIQTAVGEVAFSVCELISDVRLIKDDYQIVTSPVVAKSMADDLNETNDVSPVRPLRMTKKSSSNSRSVSSSTPKPLNLTINSQIVNSTVEHVETKPFHLSRDSPSTSRSADRSFNNDAETPSKRSPVAQRFYSPGSVGTSNDPKPLVTGMRKSSSQNILSRVKQYEQQDQTPVSSPVSKKSMISPLSDNVVGLFGKRKSGETSSPRRSSSELNGASKGLNNVGSGAISSTHTHDNLKETEPISIETSSAATSTTESSVNSNMPEIISKELIHDTTSNCELRIGTNANPSDPAKNLASNGGLSRGIGKQHNDLETTGSTTANDSVSALSHSDDGTYSEGEVDLNDFKSSLLVNNKIKQQLTQNELKASLDGDGRGSFTKASEDDLNYSPLDVKKPLEVNQPIPTSEITSSTESSEPHEKIEDESDNTWRLDSLVKNVTYSESTSGPNTVFSESPNVYTREKQDDDHDDGDKAGLQEIEPLKKTVIDLEEDLHEPLHVSSTRSSTTGESLNEAPLAGAAVTNPTVSTYNTASSALSPSSVEQDLPAEAHRAEESHGSSRQFDEDEFDVDEFDIGDPDNTLSELLLYLEHQTVKVISTIQALLSAIKLADSTKGDLRSGSKAINDVVSQMVEATSNAMKQSRNSQLKEHGRWVVDSLSDCGRRMDILCKPAGEDDLDEDYADKNFKQRLAGIAFDVAKCTKELVKSVEEANLKEEIAHLNARLG